MDRIVIGDVCEVLVGRGLPRPLLPERVERRQALVLCQPGSESIADTVASVLEVPSTTMTLPDRDEAKTIETVGTIYRRLAAENLGRHDTVVGVGGGAVTDVAGFVAATWLRGVESVLVPTTMLGAVDASIGGKTGINVGGKNLVGAFWHPARVAVDLDVLDSLPVALRLEGDVEALKAGLLGDPDIVSEYARAGVDADPAVVVPKAIAVKAAVVEDDFRETGRRAILNLGHTVGHAVEVVGGLPHGLAVSVGLVAAATVSNVRYGFDHRWLVDLLFSMTLPVAAAGLSRRAVIDLIARDKKRSSDTLRMVLLRAIGDPVVEPVTGDEIDLALGSVGIV